MGKNNKKRNVLIGVFVIIGILIISIFSTQLSITGLSNKYYIGDDVVFHLVAISPDGLRGQDCLANYDIIDRTNNKVVFNKINQDMPLSLLGGIDALEINYIPDNIGIFEVRVSYDCLITFTGDGQLQGSQFFNDRVKTFEVIEGAVPKSKSYFSCGDTTGTILDVHWYNSDGIREEVKEDCGFDDVCKITSSSTAECTGTRTKQDDPVINNFKQECFNGDVWNFDNFNKIGSIAKDCGEDICINAECVQESFTEIVGCVPDLVDEVSCSDNVHIQLVCNSDGKSYKEEINTCGTGFTCDITNGCIEEPLEEIEITTEDDQPINNPTTCEDLGGTIKDGKCITNTVSKDTGKLIDLADDLTIPLIIGVFIIGGIIIFLIRRNKK